MLTKKSFGNAVEYIRNEGRALEVSLLEHEFFKGTETAVLAELKKFQNADGGFGNALEPDYRAADSSVLCTTFAMDIIYGLDTPSNNEMLTSATNYLSAVMDEEKLVWRFLPEIEDNYPRAPWWSQENLAATFNNFIENPRVKICSYGFCYPELFDKETINKLVSQILKHIETRSDKASVDELLCYMTLEKTEDLPESAQKILYEKICKMIPESIETDENKWGDYGLKPVQLIKSPDSQFRTLIPELVKMNLQYELEQQTEEGCWLPNWDWAGLFPDSWATAKQEWSGVLTLEKLKLFRAFAEEPHKANSE